MKFLLLLHGDAAAEAAMTADERRAIVDAHGEFGRMLAERGAMVAGEALGPAAEGRTIRFASTQSEPMITDGPFLETKESLGGFYVLEAVSLDEATELASNLPRSPGLAAELLPIVPM
jgi:hypothetical protein